MVNEKALAQVGNGLQRLGEAAVPAVRLTQEIDPFRLAEVLAKSGYFRDVRDASQALVKILYGAEHGIPPVSSMMSVHVIEGKPCPSAGLLASMIKRSGAYNYRVRRLDAEAAVLDFYERGELVGTEEVTRAQITEAKIDQGSGGIKDNWRKFPKNMLFARALSNGARFYCADIFGGPVYTPEDFDYTSGGPIPAPNVNPETGEVIDAPTPADSVRERVTAASEQNSTFSGAAGAGHDHTANPRARFWAIYKEHCPEAEVPDGKGPEVRHGFVTLITGAKKPITSLENLSPAAWTRIADAMQAPAAGCDGDTCVQWDQAQLAAGCYRDPFEGDAGAVPVGAAA